MKFIKKVIRALAYRVMLLVGHLAPISNKKILVSSYYGKGYGDNPKYIVEALLKRNQNYKIYWIVIDDGAKSTLPDGVKAVKLTSVLLPFHSATAKIWIDNCRREFMYYKKKGQFYLQTWHGFALKRIEKDVAEHLDQEYVENAIRDSKAIDLIVSDSKFMTGVYQNSFWYGGKIAEFGAPRNDEILCTESQKKNRAKIQNYYHLPREAKILLYAPTFRADKSLEPYKIDFKRVMGACKEKFASDFVVLVRLHPNICERSSELDFSWGALIVDVSKFPDMQVLLSASDVVISDYSSLMFDFAISKKPCFQFATDIEEYKKDRNFYFPLDNLPFSVAKNNEELLRDISEFNQERYQKALDEFFSRVGMILDGKASEKCAEIIEDICFNKEK